MDGGRRCPVAIVDWQRQAAESHRAGNEADGRGHPRKDGQAGPSEQPSRRYVRRLRRRPGGRSGLFQFANQCGDRTSAAWLPIRGRAYMSAPDGATWRSGYATVCKTVYTSSILVVASINNINGLDQTSDFSLGSFFSVGARLGSFHIGGGVLLARKKRNSNEPNTKLNAEVERRKLQCSLSPLPHSKKHWNLPPPYSSLAAASR